MIDRPSSQVTTVVYMFETGQLHLSRAKTVTQVTVCSLSPLLWEGPAAYSRGDVVRRGETGDRRWNRRRRPANRVATIAGGHRW